MTSVTVGVNSEGPPGSALPVPEGGYARWVTPGGWIHCVHLRSYWTGVSTS